MSKELQVAIKAAQKAGGAVLTLYKKEGLGVSAKKDASPVTEADLLSQSIIEQELRQLPYPILSEEKKDDRTRLGKERLWIVDPLDGTKDFVSGTEEFSIMIGLVYQGKPQLGVVYAPALDLLYVAEKGQGAFLYKGKEKKRQVLISSPKSMNEAILVVSRYHVGEKEEKAMQVLHVKKTEQVGSVGVKIGLIAQGKAHLYFNLSDKTHQWDTCAPECIVREAGGVMSDTAGNDLVYDTKETNNKKGIVAAVPSLHGQLLSALGSLRA